MNHFTMKNYNLSYTLLGGQAFNWDLINGTFYGFTSKKIIKIIPVSDGIMWQTYPEKDNETYIQKYLNLEDDYDKRLKVIANKDKYIKKAIEKFNGLRLLNQDFEQTLLSFILSSHKSVKGVRKAVRDLSKTYGDEIKVDEIKFYLFPKTERLLSLTELHLREIGFGFRAPYFKEAVHKLYKNRLNLESMSVEEVRKYLISFTGIGEKIADCIMVFSLGFNEITPLDIWGKRVLTEFYQLDTTLKYQEMRKWYQNYFGENTAIAGQYLFEYIRTLRK